MSWTSLVSVEFCGVPIVKSKPSRFFFPALRVFFFLDIIAFLFFCRLLLGMMPIAQQSVLDMLKSQLP